MVEIPLRVLHVIPSLGKGGAERLCLDIVRELSSRSDIEVTLCSLSPVNEYEEEYSDVELELAEVDLILSPLRNGRVDLAAFEKVVDRSAPHIIHSHLYFAELVSRLCSRSGIAYWSHGHDNMSQLETLDRRSIWKKATWTDAWERRLLYERYNRVDDQSFIAISQDVKNYLQRVLPDSLVDKVYVEPNAIDLKHFLTDERAAPETPFKIINVGSLVPKKGQQRLLSMMQAFKEMGIPAELELLGDGPDRSRLEAEIVSFGLEDCVKLRGKVDHVAKYLKEADVYVHSAFYEPFGLVLIEALACGLPVYAPDGGGNMDLADSNGVQIFKTQDPEDWAHEVKAILSDELRYRSQSRASVEFVRPYDIASYVDRLLTHYRRSIQTI